MFIKDKFLKLMLPFLGGVIFLRPLIGYVRYVVSSEQAMSYPRYWMEIYFQQKFEHFHFWFLPILFLFFLSFLLLQ